MKAVLPLAQRLTNLAFAPTYSIQTSGAYVPPHVSAGEFSEAIAVVKDAFEMRKNP